VRKAIEKEFRGAKPRAIVLDDDSRVRRLTALNLLGREFEVIECANFDEFERKWSPGTVDVIIADWRLSDNHEQFGNRVLEQVRKRDWDVPFVLVSGQLGDATAKTEILSELLSNGSARFVTRGEDNGVEEACESAEVLIERRDLALLKVILSLRPAALQGATLRTSSGLQPVSRMLADVVLSPAASHDAERPLTTAIEGKE
jgi:CheY-like chemotaxis protein